MIVKFKKPGAAWGYAYNENEIGQIDAKHEGELTDAGVITRATDAEKKDYEEKAGLKPAKAEK